MIAATSLIPPSRPWPRRFAVYAVLQSLWFALYALLGKGFAYAGFAPFYIGELLLVIAFGVVLTSGRLSALLRTPVGTVFAIFLVYQVMCSVPYLDTYGLDTLRDSVIWAYSIFAFTAAALVLRLPGALRRVVLQFGNFSRMFLFLGPIAWVVTIYFGDRLPYWPDTHISIPLVKGGDFCVHLAGIFAFISLGLSTVSRWWLPVVLGEALLGMRARGGLVAFIFASFFVFCLRPKLDRFLLACGAGIVFLVAMAALDVRIGIPNTTREFSLDDLSQSVTSVFSSREHGELENTKRWRIAWWNKIWDYTVEGPYFWTGKGYGINLADSDGFQSGTREEPLRSPHNSHLTFMARSGIPGFGLWVALQLTWAGTMISAYIEASRIKAREFAGFFAWLLSYWIAFCVCAGFDVFLEGPVAGIPFWIIFGLGWGGKILFDNQIARTNWANATSMLALVSRR